MFFHHQACLVYLSAWETTVASAAAIKEGLNGRLQVSQIICCIGNFEQVGTLLTI